MNFLSTDCLMSGWIVFGTLTARPVQWVVLVFFKVKE